MKKIIKHSIILFILFICTLRMLSQNIENVVFTAKDSTIIIRYDLINCPSNKKYDVAVRFKDETNKTIIPTYISGDLQNIFCGKDKTIYWDVFKDRTELSGNIKAMVEITKSHNIKGKGGPGNALLSLLIPGLGVKYVSNGQVKGWPRTVIVYGLYAFGVGFKLLSNSDYKKYHNSQDQASMDEYYKSANSYNKLFYSFIGLGTLVWIYDIIWVAGKGAKNKRSGGLGLNYDNNSNSLCLTYRIKL